MKKENDVVGVSESTDVNATEKKPSKLKSAKLWITIWAVLMVSFIVIANREAYQNIAQWLCAVPLAYIGANVMQKKIFEDGNRKEQ